MPKTIIYSIADEFNVSEFSLFGHRKDHLNLNELISENLEDDLDDYDLGKMRIKPVSTMEIENNLIKYFMDEPQLILGLNCWFILSRQFLIFL